MKIAVIAWGSLIWDPRTLACKFENWKTDGPTLPIEFSRISKDGRITLVIDEEHGTNIQTYWNTLSFTNLQEAKENLRFREKTEEKCISEVEASTTTNDPMLKEIQKWLQENELDAAIWTGIPSNWNAKRSPGYTRDEITKYLKESKDTPVWEKLKNYIIKAPKQTQTNMRSFLESEIDRLSD